MNAAGNHAAECFLRILKALQGRPTGLLRSGEELATAQATRVFRSPAAA
jgi:hypothetical protein